MFRIILTIIIKILIRRNKVLEPALDSRKVPSESMCDGTESDWRLCKPRDEAAELKTDCEADAAPGGLSRG